MSTYITATEPMTCTCCEAPIGPGEDYVLDGVNKRPVGYECGCGDPLYADEESQR